MAAVVVKNFRAYLADLQISASMAALAIEMTADAVDKTSIQDTARTFIGGLPTGRISASGFVDLGVSESSLFGAVGVSGRPLTVLPGPMAQAELCYFMEALQASFQPGAQIGELYKFTLDGSANGPIIRGFITADQSTGSSSTGAGIQLGAVSASQRLYAALHVLSNSGGGTLDVQIESDDNALFSSSNSRLAFTQRSAVGSEFKSVAGAITDDYFRASFTIAGGGTWTFIVAIGVK